VRMEASADCAAWCMSLWSSLTTSCKPRPLVRVVASAACVAWSISFWSSFRAAGISFSTLATRPNKSLVRLIALVSSSTPSMLHHHGALSIAAYGFPISEQERIPPSAPRSTTSTLPLPPAATRAPK
jgi:phosphatidylserine synthase